VSGGPDEGTPRWFTLLLVLLAAPGLLFMHFVGATPSGTTARTLAWLYPLYAAASAICAHICYPDRRELAWILAVLLAMSDAAMWLIA